jgi:hypothetical protein
MISSPSDAGERPSIPAFATWAAVAEPLDSCGSGGGWANIEIAPRRLEALFGAPHRHGDGQKVTGINFFHGPDGVYHTLND